MLDRTDLDLYDELIRVELVERLRGMVKFEGIDAAHRDHEQATSSARETSRALTRGLLTAR